MKKENQLRTDKTDNLKTGEDIEELKDKTTSRTPDDDAGIVVRSQASGDKPAKAMTPQELSQKKYYDEQANKERKVTEFYNTLKNCSKVLAWIIGVSITLFVGYGAYYIGSISEPIGRLKKSVEGVEKSYEELKVRINKQEERLTETREEFLRNK